LLVWLCICNTDSRFRICPRDLSGVLSWFSLVWLGLVWYMNDQVI